MSEQELHDRTWKVIAPRFREAEDAFLSRYDERKHTSQASSDINEIVKAAISGRVKSLAVIPDMEAWGKVDMENDRIEIHDSWQPGDVDLFDEAVLSTLVKGGQALLVNGNRLPSKTGAAAIYRY